MFSRIICLMYISGIRLKIFDAADNPKFETVSRVLRFIILYIVYDNTLLTMIIWKHQTKLDVRTLRSKPKCLICLHTKVVI